MPPTNVRYNGFEWNRRIIAPENKEPFRLAVEAKYQSIEFNLVRKSKLFVSAIQKSDCVVTPELRAARTAVYNGLDLIEGNNKRTLPAFNFQRQINNLYGR
jgi:hypothetical protein